MFDLDIKTHLFHGKSCGVFGIFIALLLFHSHSFADTNDLPSWQEGPAKRAIVAFVEDVTNNQSKSYVAPEDRIATFDNDGTLWAEQPLYFQLFFAFDQIKKMAPNHPDWQNQEPFASVLKGDYKGALKGGKADLAKILMASHTDMTTEEFKAAAKTWLSTAKHPKTQKLFTEMVYQPMLELLDYLRANQFHTYIVSGGGIDLIRVFSNEVYGIPPEQVVGSSVKATYEIREGIPVIVKQPELFFYDDKEGKPIAIHQHIGKRPILAVGNSDGDYQMIEWTTAGKMPRLGVFIHHTDGKREWAYDRDSQIGQFNKGLDEAKKKGWVVVDMKKEWKKVFPFEQ